MRCSKCGSDNREGRRFCRGCGSKIGTVCPKCGSTNEPDEEFCGDCGAVLRTGSKPIPELPTDEAFTLNEAIPTLVDGERKTVTALFADIKGSMELMEGLDPEEAQVIVDPALKLMIDAVNRYGGYIVQSTGDGIFALFGAPLAYEDHPQRALYAALRLQEQLARYSNQLRGRGRLPLQARVGINTGEVVVRSIQTGEGHTEYTPIGHSTSLAARMQALAPVGSIAATDVTRKLGEGYFTFKSLGPTVVKGVSEPVEVFEVTGLGPLRTRLQRSASRGLTKFVGREREMDALKRGLELAKAGHGQMVAAIADPGVGKSRLFYEFKATSQSECMVLEAFSVSHGRASAYLPVIDLLQGYFEITTEDDTRKRSEKVTGKVLMLDRALENTLPYLFSLLGIADSPDPLAQMDGQLKKRHTLEAITQVVLRESLNQPLMVIFEDLHWIDAETQALLNVLADRIADSRVLLMMSYRPEYHDEWRGRADYTQLRLEPLGQQNAGEMLSALLGDAPELTSLKRTVVQRTEGNPFFIEELVQALFDEGALVRNGTIKVARSLSQLRIPPTAQAVLAARIDRLPGDRKELLQTLAIVGRESSLGLIGSVVPLSDSELDGMLGDLQLAEFIYEQPAFPDVEYVFKHSLTQEVAYNSVLTERRKVLHERTAVAMESLYAGRLDQHLSELARHYRLSSNIEKAVTYLGLAGQQAVQRSAHGEAGDYLTAGLELLKELPDSSSRARQELALQIALAQSLTVTRGLGAPEAASILLRAEELGKSLADPNALLIVWLGLMTHYSLRLKLQASREIGERACTLTEGAAAELLKPVHGELGMTLMLLGDFAGAGVHCERAFAGRELSEADFIGPFDESNPYPLFVPLTLWGLGYCDQARLWSRKALTVAKKLPRPAFLALAHSITAMFHMLLRDPCMAQVHADAAIAMVGEYPIPFALAHASIMRGWAIAIQGNLEQGIAEMRQAIVSAEAAGYARRPRWFPFLAELEAMTNGVDAGLNVMSEGLALLESTEERLYEAELHRVRGELLLMQNDSNVASAKRCFEHALEVARKQSAKCLELRATMSSARLLAKKGKRNEARLMLAEIYSWFTEGFDTADLKQAKALLDELSR